MAERFTVEISTLAERDLKGIIHYLMTNYSHNSALRVASAITDKMNSLASFPEAHPQYVERKSEGIDIKYRYAIAKKVHRIVFTVEIEANKVIVATIKNVRTPKATVIRSKEEE